MSAALGEALAAVARGWPTVPLAPRSKAPAGWLVPHGWKNATADPAVIRAWCSRHPELGFGIACEPSGLLVIDWDPRNGPDDLHDLEQRLGQLPLTVEVLTGGGGRHLYFQLPDFDTRAELAPGVELKRRGYVVAPPSIHPDTGRAYEWAEHPDDVPVAELPGAWLEACAQPRPSRPAARAAGHSSAADDDDPLKRIPASLYVERLTRQTPDRRGFVTCPVHNGGQERTPSLRAFDGDGGWYCFGCRKGGGIYQLAALIGGYPLPIKGTDFLTVQQALQDHFLAYYEQRNAAA